MEGVSPNPEDAEDEAHLTEWTPEIRISISGFDDVFLAESKRAVDRATEGLARADAPAVAGATAAAVLLAAAACEARLSEFVTRHETAIGAQTVEEIRRPTRDRGDAARQWRRLLENRAATFEYEKSPMFRALRCLFELRDLVAHRHARYLQPGDWPEKLKPCIEQKAIPVHEEAYIDWTSGVYVQKVAAWAHQTAADWLATATSVGVTG